jgi:mxaJ protein
MSSAFRRAALLVAFLPLAFPAQRTTPNALRVCADPNNLPFSNDRGEGFENRIATLVARDLGLEVEYTWWAQRRGFVRNTLNERLCDVVIGVPAHLDMLLTTKPYYRSAYVFVTRRDRQLIIRSFDDARLRKLRIGVPVVGDDYAGTPPMHALARRGLLGQLVGYSVYGDYGTPSPPMRLVEAVADGSVDVAVAWGPLAGFVAQKSPVPLVITPVVPPSDLRTVPFAYDIAMGVRRADRAFRARLDSVIVRRRPAIDSILAAYGVPRVPNEAMVSTSRTATHEGR